MDAESGWSQKTLLDRAETPRKPGQNEMDAEEWTAKVHIVVIGVGYLFPIAAIWAAFDYWKELFPDQNVEFAVTAFYQVGSIVTVGALSLIDSFSFGPRILGGFLGQLLCLAAILGFRWLPVPSSVLYQLLLLVVLLCSVATGFLDSALLSLCSQYSSNMQGYLQIGLGFGTLVSVIYRDGTKLFMSRDVEDSTCAFFVIALLTVLLCISSYLHLMSLPASKHLNDSSDVLQAAATSYGTLSSPSAGRNTSLSAVLQIVWFNQLMIFSNFILTTICYPALITAIPCRQMQSLASAEWFQTLLLTIFTLFDISARFVTHIRFGLHHGNIQWTVIIRALLLPLMIFCAASQIGNDVLSMAAVACFGFLNGYCASLCLIVVNEIPDLSAEQRKTCGRISAVSVNCGLCVGSLAAIALGNRLKLS